MRDGDRWGALEVRHLRAFVAVVDEGSFGQAANRLDYTQSGVSQQVLALERIVGAPLLLRHPGGRRPVELTDAGRTVLAHARSLLARVNATQADIEALEAGDAGPIRVAAFQSVATRVLPAALARFRGAHPKVRVEVRQALTIDELLALIESGRAELGFGALPLARGPFRSRPLLDDGYVMVTAPGRRERRLGDLHGKRILGVRGCQHDLMVEQRMLSAGIVPAAFDRFDDNEMIQALAAAGEGIAVVPRLAVDPSDPRIATHPLPELPARKLVGIVHRERTLRKAIDELFDAAARVSRLPRAGLRLAM